MSFYKVTQRPQYYAARYLIESETGVVLCGSESIDHANHIVAVLNAYTSPSVCQHDPLLPNRTVLPTVGGVVCIVCKRSVNYYGESR